MIPICGRVTARSKPGIIHTLLVGVLAILWICTLSISSVSTVSQYDDRGLYMLVQYDLIPVRHAVTVFSVLVASFDMLRALARRIHLRNRIARTTIPLLVCCQLGNALLEFLYPFAYVTGELAPFIIITFLWYLFPTGAFVCAWYVMSSPEISVDLVYTQVLPSPYVNISEAPSMVD
ncbi:hypothetical protein ASPSYDRAFT_92013 [Aspergillus sydowii CBS 593.65]|uniref:Uncharacterized protein n=1 Tax=Aspergillus sydowii CBS 593.65 TaxID=1036612 RepID=A0A1L9T8Q2_9EURO|nr:uncharacterized protein ASPSYDRAFT_92013 [Aspergillus sydowii CBS 593.65]OJJ55802.1 hypothetical protein ASPSYDRAFT_92013 [Aspergillus sydowii CBS 593.65]